jgi:hypothetical protein
MTHTQIITLFTFLFTAGICKAQHNGLFDSALISRNIDKMAGTWYYGNEQKDTIIIRIEKNIDKDSLPGAIRSLPMVLAWIYYKKKDSIAEWGLKKFAPDKYTKANSAMIGSYLDYEKAVVFNYKDPGFQWLSHVILTLKKKKLYWKIKHKLDEENKRHNFFYPEKLILRRMKKNLL